MAEQPEDVRLARRAGDVSSGAGGFGLFAAQLLAFG